MTTQENENSTGLTFDRFPNRKDKALTGFSSTNNAALLRAICTNSTTGYVRQLVTDGPVSVPNHAADAVEAHLVKRGWVRT